MANRDTVKSWFETGDYPTQEQFWQLFEWLFFKDENISQAAITGLVAALASKADSSVIAGLQSRLIPTIINVPGATSFPITEGHLIDRIVIIPQNADSVKAGIVDGQDDVIMEVGLVAGMANVFSVQPGVYGVDDTTIYFSGFTGTAQIIIFKR